MSMRKKYLGKKSAEVTQEQLAFELENLYKEVADTHKVEEEVSEPDLKEYYEFLKVKPDAPHEELKGAYEELAQSWDPARFQDHPEWLEKAEKKTAAINRAYEAILSARIRAIKNTIKKQGQRKEPEQEPEVKIDDFETPEIEVKETAIHPKRSRLLRIYLLIGIPAALLATWLLLSPFFNGPPTKSEIAEIKEITPPSVMNRPSQQPLSEQRASERPQETPTPGSVPASVQPTPGMSEPA